MLALHAGELSDTDNPVIQFVYIEPRVSERPFDDPGFIADVESLTYRVLQPDGTEHMGVTAVDLDAAVDGGDRIRLGTYAPPIMIGLADPLGSWKVEWTAIREVASDPAITWTMTFPVVAADENVPDGYALVSEARAEGIPVGLSDQQIFDAIERASRFVEEYTGRFFEPRYSTSHHDGSGNHALLLYDPVIGVEELEFVFSDFRPMSRIIDHSSVRIYNRHIRPNPLRNPDDRNSPKIEILRVDNTLSRRFDDAAQNVQVTGWFGYTEYDGSPLGRTPRLLQRLVLMLAMRDIRPLWEDFSGGRRSIGGGVLVSEKTRDQSATWATTRNAAGGGAAGDITGDAEIDRLLQMFRGPIRLSAV